MDNLESGKFEGPIFLYEEIKAGIKELIIINNLKAGQKIPTESDLCESFNVSRITIRRAIKELVEEGVIEVVRGKGTFVKSPKKNLHLLNLKGFTEGLSNVGNHIEKEILSMRIVRDEPKISKVFLYEQIEILELVRIVKDKDGAFSVDYSYLPLSLYPEIETFLTNNVSTFKLIREKYKVKFSKVKKEIEYIQPSPDICEYLGITKTSPVILVKKTIYGYDHAPVHYSEYYLLGDRVKFYIEADYTD